MPSFFVDLNLDQVIYKINSLRKNADVKKLYYMLSDSEETQKMRRVNLSIISRREVFDAFSSFSDALYEVGRINELTSTCTNEKRKNALCVAAAYSYFKAIDELLEKNLELSGRLGEVLVELSDYFNEKHVQESYKKAAELYRRLGEKRYRLIIKRDSFVVKTEVSSENYIDKLLKIFPDASDDGFESPFSHLNDLSHIETESYLAVSSQDKELFSLIDSFAEGADKLFNNEVFDFNYELNLYLSFSTFVEYMRDNGFAFAEPTTGNDLHAEGVYDLALALTLFKADKKVIDNNLSLVGEEKFLVITGPNQGGKTTFARSVGQLLYFNSMGLMVPAMSASLPFYNGILTHFSVEESTETGQGKLKEELSRLAPMMAKKQDNQFVILNELFTTAATYDAEIMGKRVMEHFMSLGYKGIYVTHIKELTRAKDVVSLVACVDENDYHRRLYKLVRKPAEGLGYAGAIVEKYGLTTDMLRERFGELGLIDEEVEK